ncbi:MAG TPA: single-stranded DNA-binding protein [Solirubrobacteraceae bacterium]|nr:single-stranded DNA-binding protein [Solirubrobacteraceae bacterium]
MSSFTINRVVLVGRLTRDPELRALPSGLSVCQLRVACSSTRKDAEGDYHDKPNYFNVSVFGSSADSVCRYTRKGRRVAIDGRLEWREWESSEQQKRQAVNVVAEKVLFLDGPGEREAGEPREQAGSDEQIESDEQVVIGEQASTAETDHDQQPDGELVGIGAGSEDVDLIF